MTSKKNNSLPKNNILSKKKTTIRKKSKSKSKAKSKSSPNKRINNNNKSFNSQVISCLKDCKLTNSSKRKINNLSYVNEKNYQSSFENIITFSKKISATRKKAINTIIFNAANADGVFSAYIAIKYLKENGIKDINIIPGKPWSGRNTDYRIKKMEDQLRDRTVLVVDISYNDATFKYIKSVSKDMIIIDDHTINNRNNKNNINAFIGDNKHATVAYVWKFFYPTKDVPIYVQYVDDSDRKLFLPHLSFQRLFTSFVNYRFIHNPHISFQSIEDFNSLGNVIDDVNITFSEIVGYYYDEVANNIKEQVARNAQKRFFQGYPVYVLNYNDPALSKMVARQIVTNAEKRGDNIAFAVLWGFEYTKNAYRIFLSEKHDGEPKYNLPQIAKKLGNIGGVGESGKGARFIGNFYWPKKKGMDIWDLFTKTPTYLKKI